MRSLEPALWSIPRTPDIASSSSKKTIFELLNHQFHFQLEIIDRITKKFEPFLSDDLKSRLKIDIYQNTQTNEYQLIFNIDSNDDKEYQQLLTELEQSIQLYHTYYYQFIKANRCLLYLIKFLNTSIKPFFPCRAYRDKKKRWVDILPTMCAGRAFGIAI